LAGNGDNHENWIKSLMLEPDQFIAKHTEICAPPLVPELPLHLATGVTALWQATEEWLARQGLPPPYWAFAWPGGQALARQILDQPQLVAGRRVLDLAAGSGLVAIAAARAGAGAVTAVEIDAVAGAAIRLNALLNRASVTTLIADLVGQPLAGIDVVLAGDVCYERPMAARIVPWLAGLAGEGRLVLIGDPGRNYLSTTGLEAVAHHLVPTSLDLEDREQRETTVWRVTPQWRLD